METVAHWCCCNVRGNVGDHDGDGDANDDGGNGDVNDDGNNGGNAGNDDEVVVMAVT